MQKSRYCDSYGDDVDLSTCKNCKLRMKRGDSVADCDFGDYLSP